MPLLEILKPVYNQERFVPMVAKNIRDFSSNSVLVSIQDDYSSDRTYEAYRSEGLFNTRITRTPERGGPRANIASLLENSIGEFINFSAGDDFLVPDLIRSFPKVVTAIPADMYVFRCVKVPFNLAVSLSFGTQAAILSQRALSAHMKNVEVTTRKWGSTNELLKMAATTPGFLWNQGVIIRGDIARRAGFLPAGETDDWGLQHNLATLAESGELISVCFTDVLAILSNIPSSFGNDACKQLRRQFYSIDRYWDESLKKQALLNSLSKKITQFQHPRYTYGEIRDALSSCFSNSDTSALK